MNAQKKQRRKINDDFKIQIIEDLLAGKLRPADVRKQGIYSSMLARWRQQYDTGELKRSESNASTPNGGALVSADPPKPVEVVPAPKRKYTRRMHQSIVSDAQSALVNKEVAFWLDRFVRGLVNAIQARQIGPEELTRDYNVAVLNAVNAARGGK